MNDEKYERLIAEIEMSRKMNSEQHMQILESANDTRELSNTIQDVLHNFDGFAKTIKWVRGVILTVGFLYLIFEKQLHSIMGG